MLQEICGRIIKSGRKSTYDYPLVLQDAATTPTKNLWKKTEVYQKGIKKDTIPNRLCFPSFPSRADRTSIVPRFLASSSVCPDGLANRRGRRGQAGGGLGGGEN